MFTQGHSGRCLKLAHSTCQVPWLRNIGAVPPRLQMPSWRAQEQLDLEFPQFKPTNAHSCLLIQFKKNIKLVNVLDRTGQSSGSK